MRRDDLDPARGIINAVGYSIVFWLLVLLLLSGCSVYVAAEHKSDPHIEYDGYDLACAGLKYDERLELKAGYCKDVREGYGLFELRVEYDWEIYNAND